MGARGDGRAHPIELAIDTTMLANTSALVWSSVGQDVKQVILEHGATKAYPIGKRTSI